jgi:hypothetical protein
LLMTRTLCCRFHGPSGVVPLERFEYLGSALPVQNQVVVQPSEHQLVPTSRGTLPLARAPLATISLSGGGVVRFQAQRADIDAEGGWPCRSMTVNALLLSQPRRETSFLASIVPSSSTSRSRGGLNDPNHPTNVLQLQIQHHRVQQQAQRPPARAMQPSKAEAPAHCARCWVH